MTTITKDTVAQHRKDHKSRGTAAPGRTTATQQTMEMSTMIRVITARKTMMTTMYGPKPT